MYISTFAAAIMMMAAVSCTDVQEPPVEDAPAFVRTMTVTDSVAVDYVAGSFSVDVEANFEYWVDPQESWIKFDKIEGTKVWFNIEANEKTVERVGQVKLDRKSVV